MTTEIFFLIIFFFLFISAITLNRVLISINKKLGGDVSVELSETLNTIKLYRNLFFFFSGFVVAFYIGYYFTTKYHLESHVLEWLNLIVRWTHVVFGIAWIGASFYFIFLENSLNRTENLRDELAGNLWAIHGGGFYYVEKYKSAPPVIPQHLHWFKYEAYFTWLTGMLLLTLVYFMNAKAVMIDSSVRDISSTTAILIGSGTMFLGWFIYDWMCKSPLLQKKKLFGLIGFAIVVLISFFLSKMLSGRAAFILVGGLLGTIMAGNVFFCIIPSQKALVAAAKADKPVNPELGKIAGLRSLHNNYIVLPVIFIMISNHFPTTFGSNFNWAILAGLTIASVAVRHYHNLYEKGQNVFWLLPFAAIALIALVIVTAPEPRKTSSNLIQGKNKQSTKNLGVIKFSQVNAIIQKRCIQCHSSTPTDDVNKIAPTGVKFDTPDEIKNHADRIFIRAVQTETMPQNNKTGITAEERELIGAWIEQGANF
ncbi:MAG: urate hydroxylase PuuD [Bacteroidia bacterium]